MLGLRRGSESEQGLNSEASVPECVWDGMNVAVPVVSWWLPAATFLSECELLEAPSEALLLTEVLSSPDTLHLLPLLLNRRKLPVLWWGRGSWLGCTSEKFVGSRSPARTLRDFQGWLGLWAVFALCAAPTEAAAALSRLLSSRLWRMRALSGAKPQRVWPCLPHPSEEIWSPLFTSRRPWPGLGRLIPSWGLFLF